MCYVFIPHNDIFLLPERAERACLEGVPFSTPVGKKNVLMFIKNDNHKQQTWDRNSPQLISML